MSSGLEANDARGKPLALPVIGYVAHDIVVSPAAKREIIACGAAKLRDTEWRAAKT